MATLHYLRQHAVHPPRRTTGTILTAGLLSGVLLATPAAHAAPGDGDARSAYRQVAAEVAAIQARVTDAEETLQRMTIEAEAASGAALAAQAALAAAQAEATASAAELAAVRDQVKRTQEDVVDLGREAYMGSGEDTFGDVAVLLDADSPAEALQQAATLEVLGEQRTDQLDELEDGEAREARLDRAARTAAADQGRAARAADEAEATAEAQLSVAQGTYDALAAEKATLDAQLREAEVRMLGLRGVGDPAGAWAGQQAAKQASGQLTSTGGAVPPTNGRITSCYGSRGGTLHAGVDIAAPLGTAVFTPEAGVVLKAGPASGFGLAVYIQHDDGSITVYGHINDYFVSAGQVVVAGQQVAEVGNKGLSTGAHLHFEVQTGGLFVNRVDPAPWLAARGISLGGC